MNADGVPAGGCVAVGHELQTFSVSMERCSRAAARTLAERYGETLRAAGFRTLVCLTPGLLGRSYEAPL